MKIKQDSEEYQSILKETKEALYLGDNINDLKLDLINRESNYNNADITSGQKCFTNYEIEEAVNLAVEEIGSNYENTDEIMF